MWTADERTPVDTGGTAQRLQESEEETTAISKGLLQVCLEPSLQPPRAARNASEDADEESQRPTSPHHQLPGTYR